MYLFRLFVVMLFSALGVNMALAMPIATSKISFYQAENTLFTQADDVGFAAPAPPMAVSNVAATGGITVIGDVAKNGQKIYKLQKESAQKVDGIISVNNLEDGLSKLATNTGLGDAQKAGILREASNLPSGNRILAGSATRAEASELGQAWVGPNYRVAGDGKTLISTDGLRQYRPPQPKPNSPFTQTGTQANFQQRHDLGTTWTSNAHIDISD